MPSIDRTSSTPFYLQVYEQIAHGIESGVYPAGKKLPSIRECARELDVSNTTIEMAYQRLVEEGYVQARRGSGYTICKAGGGSGSRVLDSGRFEGSYLADRNQLIGMSVDSTGQEIRFDFAYDKADASLFPLTTWARICREVYFEEGAQAACLYNDAQGLYALRDEIARYLNREYGLSCIPEQVLVMPTTRALVSEILSLFEPDGTVIAMENPGYDEVGRHISRLGFTIRPVAMHPFSAWDAFVKELDGTQLAFTTPSCQFPTNQAMPLETRSALVEWARENDAYIIDDEYGWELQSGADRLPSPAALDSAGRVITIGTFSNAFTPAIALSYAVLPPRLMMKWRARSGESHPQSPWQTQAAMVAFMRNGHWRAHVRRLRTTMRQKKQILLDAMEAHMGGSVEVVKGPSSQFVLAQALDGRSEAELIEAAAKQGVQVYPTTRFWHGNAPETWRYVQIGFAGISSEDIEPGVTALARAWGFGARKNRA